MSKKIYTVFHSHDTLSNPVAGIDSVTKAKDYIEKAKEDGMIALGISNHGTILQWYTRKKMIEKAGMKYIHAAEFYLTNDYSTDDKHRDNYHCVLMARNYEGFKELNRLFSLSWTRDNHFYNSPRITFEELFNTSENIIVSTACIASPLAAEINRYAIKDKKTKEIIGYETKRQRIFGDDLDAYNKLVDDYVNFLSVNKDRCFLELQHHNTPEQREYNKLLLDLHSSYDIPLITGTDTHCLNKEHERARKVLQERKKIHFDEENGWDLTWKTYDELIICYEEQEVVPNNIVEEAVENTMVLSEMIEPFDLDTEFKYPKIYDKPVETLRKHTYDRAKSHPVLNYRYTFDELKSRIDKELDTFETCKASNYILLQEYIADWCKKNNIHIGLGRGSCVASLVLYILGVTEVDPIKHNLIFSRFMSPSRITLADIDIDIGSKDRDKVEEFVVGRHLEIDGIESAVIMTENTIELKGSIKDVCGGFFNMYENERKKGTLDKDNPYVQYKRFTVQYAQELSNSVEYDEDKKPYVPQDIIDSEPEVFHLVDIVRGTCTSVGVHASGKLVTDRHIDEVIGSFTTTDTPYRLTSLNMEELESQYYVKEDLLGLKNLQLINSCCENAGIEIIKADSIDTEDGKVWSSVRNDTTAIFQFESNSAGAFLKNFASPTTVASAQEWNDNFRMLDWVAIANAAIRPAAASYRNKLAAGEKANNGWDEIDKLLSDTNGYLVYQEQIMQFLVKFCGYSESESDVVRRKIAHKGGTQDIIPEIKKRFIETAVSKYDLDEHRAMEIIEPFLQIILDASRYAFNKSHAIAYTYTSYEIGYLRYHYPLEFITAALNSFSSDEEKTSAIIQYANKFGIKIKGIKFGYSRAEYFFDKDSKAIYKGIGSIKYMNAELADKLYKMSHKGYISFADLLIDMKKERIADVRQIDGLIKLDFFSDFGNAKELMNIKYVVEMFKYGEVKQIKKEKIPEDSYLFPLMEKYANGFTKSGDVAKSYDNIDCVKVLHGAEKAIKEMRVDDFSYTEKMAHQQDFLGYISLITDKEEDRPKLYVTKTMKAVAKATGKIFGLRIWCRSIGSGKESMFTIPINGRYDPIQKRRAPSPLESFGEVKEGDVIYCKKYDKNKKNGTTYYNLLEYVILERR